MLCQGLALHLLLLLFLFLLLYLFLLLLVLLSWVGTCVDRVVGDGQRGRSNSYREY